MAPALTAEYTNPSAASKSFTHALPACPFDPSASEKTTLLSALRSAVTELQSEINEFLTQKMEEDKAGALTAGAEMHGGDKAGGEEEGDSEAEEEGYGEEKVED